MKRTPSSRALPFLLACAVPAAVRGPAAQRDPAAEQVPQAEQVPPAERRDSAVGPQEPPAAQVVPAAPMPALQRDVFTYVAVGRRDPFVPAAPPSPEAASTALEAELLGIIGHTDPGRSLVVLRVGRSGPGGGARPLDSGPGVDGIHRLRRGDRIGGLQILAVHEDRVVVEVDGPGGVERRELELPRPRGGAR